MYKEEIRLKYKKEKKRWLITFISLYALAIIAFALYLIFVKAEYFALMTSIFAIGITALLLIATYVLLNNFLNSLRINRHYQNMVNSKGVIQEAKILEISSSVTTLSQSIKTYPVLVEIEGIKKQLYVAIYVDHSELKVNQTYQLEIVSQFIKGIKHE